VLSTGDEVTIVDYTTWVCTCPWRHGEKRQLTLDWKLWCRRIATSQRGRVLVISYWHALLRTINTDSELMSHKLSTFIYSFLRDANKLRDVTTAKCRSLAFPIDVIRMSKRTENVVKYLQTE